MNIHFVSVTPPFLNDPSIIPECNTLGIYFHIQPFPSLENRNDPKKARPSKNTI